MRTIAAFMFMSNNDPNDILIKISELIQGEHVVGKIVKDFLKENPDRTFIGINILE